MKDWSPSGMPMCSSFWIQQGILTKSTKTRLEELEATKEDLEIKIANEKIAKPRISPEFVTFWLHKFRKLDVRQQSHRKMLIDAFVNAIYLYDDKLVLTLNYKDGTKTITLDDVKEAVKNNTGSDLDCRGAPITGIPWWGIPVVMSWSGLEPIWYWTLIKILKKDFNCPKGMKFIWDLFCDFFPYKSQNRQRH